MQSSTTIGRADNSQRYSPNTRSHRSIKTRKGLTSLNGRVKEVGSVLVKIVLMGKTEGHPMFQITMTSKRDNHKATTILVKRFKHFRALHNKVLIYKCHNKLLFFLFLCSETP